MKTIKSIIILVLFFYTAVISLKLFSQNKKIEQLTAVNIAQKNELIALDNQLLTITKNNYKPIAVQPTNSDYTLNKKRQRKLKIITELNTTTEQSEVVETLSFETISKFEEYKALATSIETLSSSELKNKLDNEFNNDKNDSIIAEANYFALQNMFTENPELSGFALTNTECKSNQCRLSLAVVDAETSNQLILKLTELIKHSGSRFSRSAIMNNPDFANSRTTLYVMGIEKPI